jgi:hypothetical protein
VRQVIQYLDPRQLLTYEGMIGGLYLRRVVKRAGIECELILSLIGDRRSATSAMGTLDYTRCGVIDDRLALRVPERTLVDNDKGREGARSVTPAALTMAM